MKRALLIVDTTPTFCEGGGLPVAGGNALAAVIADFVAANAADYAEIIPSEDWHIHAPDHIVVDGETPDYQTKFPKHGPAGEPEAMLHPALDRVRHLFTALVRKGMYEAAFSMFQGVIVTNPGDLVPVGPRLVEYLREQEITHLDVIGIAFDFCDKATAIHGAEAGFEVRVLKDLTVSVSADNDAAATAAMVAAGVDITTSTALAA